MSLTLNPKALYNLCIKRLGVKGVSFSISADPDKVFAWIANLFRKGRS